MPIPNKQCETCNKSTLSLLLLRPSPIAKRGALVPPGSAAVVSDDLATTGLLPERLPTESRFALRLLRAGYVHVYIPSPPPGVKNWLGYRVTDNADLVPDWHPSFKAPAACEDNKHNVSGMKLLNIPQAHKITELWIAYSANLWNDTLRAKNQANRKAMKLVSLNGGSANTFQPTPENLRSKVLECALSKLSVNGAIDHDFQFNSMAQRVEDLAENLKKAAACHPKTKGKELAIVLNDPVGVATELSTLRVHRQQLANQEIEKPENAHPLKSSNLLMAIKKAGAGEGLIRAMNSMCPVVTEKTYNSIYKNSRNPKFADSWWEPMPDGKSSQDKDGNRLGRVWTVEAADRIDTQVRLFKERNWALIAKHYDEKARLDWLRSFEAKMKRLHYDELERFELDWVTACTDSASIAYFIEHFDPEDPNSPTKQHCPGRVYAEESHRIHATAPFTTGPVLNKYLTLVDIPITDESAVILRALVANQKSVIQQVHEQLTGDPGADGMRDKMYDLVKGLRSESKTLQKYAWLGHVLAGFSVGQLTALSAAGLTALGKSPTGNAKLQNLLRKIQGCWSVQWALEFAFQASAAGQSPKVPVLITLKVDVDEALKIIRARPDQNIGASRRQLKRLRRQQPSARIELSLLTDSDTLRAAQGDLGTIASNPHSGTVNMKGSAQTAAMAAASSAIVLDENKFLRLFAQQAGSANGAHAIRRAFVEATADVRAISMTQDGRLAIGSIIVQMIGLCNGVRAFNKAESPQELRDALYGILDSSMGATGGLLEMWAVAVNSRVLVQGGAGAAAKSLPLAALKFAANIAGLVGGVINAGAAFAKAEGQAEVGNIEAARLYWYSGWAFIGTGFTSGLSALGITAEYLVSRGVGGVAVRAVAIRLGGHGTAALLGLSVTGWGLVLLGAGISLQIFSMILTPTPLQTWVSRSYFGTDENKFSSWKDEHDSLLEALKDASKETSKGDESESQNLSEATAQ